MAGKAAAEETHELGCIVATTANDLLSIADRLHDEYFDVDEIAWDEKARTLDIPFRRIFHDGPSRRIKNRLIYWVDEVDVLRCSLRFLDVVTYTLDDRTNIGALSLNRFHYDEKRGVVTLECCEECGFSIRVDGLRAEYREMGYRGKARITRGICWDSNSSQVYE